MQYGLDPKCNTILVSNVIKVLIIIKFGHKYKKPLVLIVINPLLHLGPNIEASNVTIVPKCNKLRGKIEQKVNTPKYCCYIFLE